MQAVPRQLERTRVPIQAQKPDSYLRIDTLKRLAPVAYLMLLACLAGYVPGWLASRGYEFEINELRRQARLDSIRTFLAEAALNAGRGEFEEARRNSSDFFTNLQAEVDRDDPLFDAGSRSKLTDILSKRDAVITQLARGDKSTTFLLSGWYFATEDIFRGR